MGEDQPLPGMSADHAMFVGPQCVGRSRTFACPCPSGPRNCGQSLALNAQVLRIGKQSANKCVQVNIGAKLAGDAMAANQNCAAAE